MVQYEFNGMKFKEGFCMLKSGPRMGPKTFLNFFVLNTLSSKAKQLKNVLGRIL